MILQELDKRGMPKSMGCVFGIAGFSENLQPDNEHKLLLSFLVLNLPSTLQQIQDFSKISTTNNFLNILGLQVLVSTFSSVQHK